VTEIVGAVPVGEDFTLVEARITRGFRHQVRVHLASTGHPLVGDGLYGGTLVDGLGRQFLHASSLAFPHPTTGERLVAESELPEPLRRVLSALA
jgi:23S rRNA-/tRNA-specific pseudouridylate synthase